LFVTDALDITFHSVGLARAGLAVGEDTCIEAIESRLNERLDFVKDVGLLLFRKENSVEIIEIFAAASDP